MFRFIFGKRNQTGGARPNAAVVNNSSGTVVVGSGMDFSEFEESDKAVKVWLPTLIDTILENISEANETSKSEIVRTILFIHVYGLNDFESMRNRQLGWFKPPKTEPSDGEVSKALFSRSPNRFPDLGKNIVAMKLWLPRRLLSDVATLAEQSGQRTSPYVRYTVIRHLLGAAYSLDSAEQLITPEAGRWEEGEE